jgi:hypothetical protein
MFTKQQKKLFALGSILSMLFLVGVIVFDADVLARNLKGDGGSYLAALQDLKNGSLHPIRPLGYPSFLLLLSKIVWSDSPLFYQSIYVGQFFLWLTCIALLLKFLPQKKHWIWPILVGLIIFNPSYVQYSHMILTEILFLFVILLSFWGLRQYFLTQKDLGLFSFVFGMLFATLVRPGLFYFSLLIVALSFFLFIQKRHFISSIVVIVGTMLLFGLPMRIIKRTYGNFTISYIDQLTQYRYLHSRTAALIENTSVEKSMKKRDSALKKDAVKKSNIGLKVKEERQNFLSHYPSEYLNAFSKNLFFNFHAGNEYLPKNIPIVGKHFYGLSRILNMFFVVLLFFCIVLFGFRFFTARQKKQLFFPAILLAYCGYCWVTSGVSFFQGDRFNIVWMPILVIFIFQFFSFSHHEKSSRA